MFKLTKEVVLSTYVSRFELTVNYCDRESQLVVILLNKDIDEMNVLRNFLIAVELKKNKLLSQKNNVDFYMQGVAFVKGVDFYVQLEKKSMLYENSLIVLESNDKNILDPIVKNNDSNYSMIDFEIGLVKLYDSNGCIYNIKIEKMSHILEDF